jgi:O-antigen/teichoic acid export membrane protein
MVRLKKRFKIIFSSGFARNIAILAGGTAVGQILSVLASPLLTRIYSPDDFGILSVYASLLGIVSVAAGLRYELAIPLPQEEQEAAQLLLVSLFCVILTSTFTLIFVFLFGNSFAQLVRLPTLAPYLWLLPLSILLAGNYQAFSYWSIRHKSFKQLSQTRIYQSLGAIVTQLSLGILGLHPSGLILGQIVGQTTGMTTLAKPFLARYSFFNWPFSSLRGIAIRYRNFPLYSASSAFLNNSGLYLPAFLLASLYGSQVAGWFALGDRIIKTPLNLIGQSTSQVYLAEIANLARDNPKKLLHLYRLVSKRLFLFGVLLLIPLGIIAPWLFSIVFGEAWYQAGFYVRIMTTLYLGQFVVNPLSQTLNVLEKQATLALLDGLRVVLVIAAIAIPQYLGNTEVLAILLYTIVMTGVYAAFWLITYRQLIAYADKTT